MKFLFGIKVAIIGMGVVFIALVLLVLFIKVMGYLLALYEKRMASVKSRDAMVESKMNRAEPVEQFKEGHDTEDEYTAAICAALAAYSRNK